MYSCPECEREINAASELCPYCGTDLSALLAPAPGEPPTLARRLRVLLLFVVLIAAVWGFLLYIVPDRRAVNTAAAEGQAMRSMREIAARLADYAQAQGGKYPAALETLGEPVRRPAQEAQREGYTIGYAAAETPSGITHYQLTARAGRYGFRSFYLDESGVLRATLQDRAAAPDDPTAQ
jgi:hypothetical protein